MGMGWRVELLAAAALVVMGACARTQAGDPCPIGARPIVLEYDEEGRYVTELACLVDGFGCDAAPEPRWRWVRVDDRFEVSVPICGCDGRTGSATVEEYESIRLPVPAAHFGTCEDPCGGVERDAATDSFAFVGESFWGPIHLTPVAPECSCADGRAIVAGGWAGSLQGDAAYECWDACVYFGRLDAEGGCNGGPDVGPTCCDGCAGASLEDSGYECLAPDGIHVVPDACCHCAGATRAPDGRCLAGETQVADACCNCALADDRCEHRDVPGWPLSDACCDCTNAEPRADGSCWNAVSGLVIADFCCAP